jgi:hypothetical protein
VTARKPAQGKGRDRSAEHGWNGSAIEKAPGARGGAIVVRPLTPKERRECVRQLAGRALDAADFAELLTYVDLPAEDGRLQLDPQ